LCILEECTEFVTITFSGSGAFSFSISGEQETFNEIMKTDGTVVVQFSFAVGYGDDFLFR
jgi:hypothetical protein